MGRRGKQRSICPNGYVMDVNIGTCVPGNSRFGDGRPDTAFGHGDSDWPGGPPTHARKGPGTYKRRGGRVRYRRGRQVKPRGGIRAQAQHSKKQPFPVCASLNQQCSPPSINNQGPSCCPGLYCADPGWDQYGPQYGFTCQELGSQWNDSTECLPSGYNCTHSPACCSGFCHETEPTLIDPYPTGGTCL